MIQVKETVWLSLDTIKEILAQEDTPIPGGVLVYSNDKAEITLYLNYNDVVNARRFLAAAQPEKEQAKPMLRMPRAVCTLCGEPVALLTETMAFVCQNPSCECKTKKGEPRT